MSKTKIFIAIIAIAVIGIVALIVASSKSPVSPGVSEETGGETADVQENALVETPADVQENALTETSSEVSAPETALSEESKRGTIKLTVDALKDGFDPKTFTVKAGETIVIELTCNDTIGHVMQFRNSKIELALVAEPKGSGGEISSTTYKIPSDLAKGEYEFYDIVAEKNNLPPLVGKMIVE